MNQASATVKRSMGGMQSIAQSATFAVDDFFAAFATGGVAGGLRGAGNNLTMIAAQLGSIKAQFVIIAALAVGQLLAKQFGKGKTEAKALNDELEKMSRHFKTMESLGSIRRGIVEQQGEAAAFRNKPAPTHAEFQTERERIDSEIKSSAASAVSKQREAAQLFLETTKQQRRARALGEGKIAPDVAERLRGQL